MRQSIKGEKHNYLNNQYSSLIIQYDYGNTIKETPIFPNEIIQNAKRSKTPTHRSHTRKHDHLLIEGHHSRERIITGNNLQEISKNTTTTNTQIVDFKTTYKKWGFQALMCGSTKHQAKVHIHNVVIGSISI